MAIAGGVDARSGANYFNNLKFVKPFKNDPHIRSITIGINVYAVTYTNQILGYDISQNSLISREDLDVLFNKFDDVL